MKVAALDDGSPDAQAGEGGFATATILSDLSANIFAALLLILILLLQIRVDASSRPPEPRPVAVERSDVARPHRPLGGADLVALLRARAPRAPGLSLDLVEAGATLPDGTLLPPGAALDDAVSRAPADEPIRLYVFSNAAFAPVTAALRRAGRAWLDVSVPRALRAPGGGQRWSSAFIDLAQTAASEASFREGLARLLAAASGPLVRDGHVAGGGGPAAGSAPAVPGGTTLANLAHMLAVALAVAALAAGAALVAFVETRVGRVGAARRGLLRSEE